MVSNPRQIAGLDPSEVRRPAGSTVRSRVQMSAQASQGQCVGEWQNDSRLRRVAVVVCTANRTFAGHTYRLQQQRLLDVLNRKALRTGRDFVPLVDVEVFSPDGRSVRRASTYIRKASILLVAERSEGQPDEPDAGEKRRATLMRRKKPLAAEIHMPLYTLAGQMHGEMWQELLDTLDGDDTFVPLTNVEISPALATGESKFSFVAVNKDQMTYVGETSE